MTASPAPASTAAQIASFDGSSSTDVSVCDVDAERGQRASKAARVPDPFSRATHVAAASRSASRPSSERAGVAGGDDQQFVFADRRHGERGIARPRLRRSRGRLLRRSGHLGDRIGVADAQLDRRRRDSGHEIAAMRRRQPVAADRLAGGERQRAGLEAGEIGERLLGRRARAPAPLSLRSRKARPAPVSAMRRPMRSNSLTPCRSSSAAIAALVADWVRFSVWAARVMCSHSATQTNTRNCSSVTGALPSRDQTHHYQTGAADEQRREQARAPAAAGRANECAGDRCEDPSPPSPSTAGRSRRRRSAPRSRWGIATRLLSAASARKPIRNQGNGGRRRSPSPARPSSALISPSAMTTGAIIATRVSLAMVPNCPASPPPWNAAATAWAIS